MGSPRPDRLIAAALGCVLVATTGRTAAVKPGLAGYAKSSAQWGRSAIDGSERRMSRSRLRLDGTVGFLDGAVKINAVDDVEFLAGSLLASREFALADAAPSPHRWDLEAGWTAGRRRITHGLYRATVQVMAAGLTGIAGRQRIAWGTGRIWNAVDVLNPHHPLAIERDERPGVDAVLLARPLGDLGKASVVWARHRDAESWLGRAARTLGETDVAVTAGRTRGEWMLAAEFAGQALDAGVRGEVAAFAAAGRSPAWRADGSVDRAVGGGVTLAAEAFFDSSGEHDARRYRFLALLTGARRTLARTYVAGTAVWEITPLVKLDVMDVLNVDDGSTFQSVRATWSVVENWDLVAGGQAPFGGVSSEFGRLEPAVFGWLIRYF